MPDRTDHIMERNANIEPPSISTMLQFKQTETITPSNRDIDEQEREAVELHTLARSIVQECKQNRPSSTLETAIFLLYEVSDQPVPLPLRVMTLNHLVMALLTRFSHWGWFADAEEVMRLETIILGYYLHQDNSAMEADGDIRYDSDEQTEMVHLGCSLLAEFGQSVEASSIDSAILLYQEVLHLRPLENPDRAVTLFDLSDALLVRFYLSEEVNHDDLDMAILHMLEAVDALPDHHFERFRYLLSLTMAWYCRFSRSGHIKNAIKAAEQLKRMEKEDDEAENLFAAGVAQLKTFHHSGSTSILNAAITQLRQSLLLRPAPHPVRSKSLVNLGSALVTKAEQTGDLLSLNEAISLHREALDLHRYPHPFRSTSQINLANGLYRRFRIYGQLSDFEEAIALYKEALELRPPHDQSPIAVTNLASALSYRFELNGNLPDLEEAIDLHRKAAELYPAADTNRAISLVNLAIAILHRFDQKGNLLDLEEAVAFTRQALETLPAKNPDRSRCFNMLSKGLYIRFDQKGHLPDLEEAISISRDALELHPESHPDRSTSLQSLASLLSMRFYHKGYLPNLRESISLHRKALELRPVHDPDRYKSLNDLACALMLQFQHTHHLPDIEESISLHREVLRLDITPSSQRPMSLNNLAASLGERCEEILEKDSRAALADIEESIGVYQESLNLLPANHPRHHFAANLAQSLIKLYSVTRQPQHLEDAIKAFREGVRCGTAPLLEQFKASRKWAQWADTWDHPSALEAFQLAIDILPRLSSLDMSLRDRQEVLVRTRGIASEAASWAIRAGLLEKSVEFLSAGRAVFWSQALHLRTPLDELESIAPSLAADLRTISTQLEYSSRRDLEGYSEIYRNVRDMEEEASRCRQLNEKRMYILDEVRKLKLPRLDDFMRPKSFDKLRKAAFGGPVVILISSEKGCHGLLLDRWGNVQHVPFPDLSLRLLALLSLLMRNVLWAFEMRSTASDSVSDLLSSIDTEIHSNQRKGMQVPDSGWKPDDYFSFVLKVLWFNVAYPIINTLGLNTTTDSPPHLWWCPTGSFSFMPIHAAGDYSNEVPVCLSDYMISSYTPTLDALLDPPTSESMESFSMLAVIAAEAPGQFPLSYAAKELQMVQKHVPTKFLKESPPSVNDVLTNLTNASFVHFACHGLQDDADPLRSALFLHDGQLTIAKIMEKPLPNARLAFLNACETAKGTDDIPDEAMHLSASLLYAGYRGVVGTMWPIWDQDAVAVADVFYGHLFRRGNESYPDPTEAAYALHLAVKRLRLHQKVSFKRWVPFIHLGV